MVVSRKMWRALFSCNTHFEIHLFALLPSKHALECLKAAWILFIGEFSSRFFHWWTWADYKIVWWTKNPTLFTPSFHLQFPTNTNMTALQGSPLYTSSVAKIKIRHLWQTKPVHKHELIAYTLLLQMEIYYIPIYCS